MVRRRKDQPVCEIETDKATVPIPSSHAGRVVKVHVAAGQSVAIGATLVTLEVAEGSSTQATPAPARPAQTPVEDAAPTPPASPARPAAAQPAARPNRPHPSRRRRTYRRPSRQPRKRLRHLLPLPLRLPSLPPVPRFAD